MALHDALGIAGVALIVGTYFSLQVGRLEVGDLRYSALNALGAALVILSLCHEFNASAFLVEVFWLAISLLGIWRWNVGRRRRSA